MELRGDIVARLAPARAQAVDVVVSRLCPAGACGACETLFVFAVRDKICGRRIVACACNVGRGTADESGLFASLGREEVGGARCVSSCPRLAIGIVAQLADV